MLKFNKYYIQNIENLKDFITVIFVIIDDLYNEHITLIYMKRNNSKEEYPKWVRKMIFKIRRRIETTFSQLMGQLNAGVVNAKSSWGLKTRLPTKILAFNLCFFVNELLGKTNDLAKIKDLLF